MTKSGVSKLHKGGRNRHVSLTNRGDDFARSLLNFYRVADSWNLFRDVADAERATAMGLHQSVYSIGMFAGPWLSGLLADAIGIRPMFGVTAFACLAVSVFLIRLLPRQSEAVPAV